MSEFLAGRLADRRAWFLAASITVLALLATFNSLPNGFTYDDRFVIVANPSVRRILGWEQFALLPYWPLHQSGDGYRPLTILLFALEWAVSPRPETFHAVTMVLYTAVCLLVLWLGLKLVSPWTAWWSAALFAVHPVHVEVTAGAVGQSELLSAIALIGAVGIYVDGRRAGPLTGMRQVAIAALFLLGLLAKEHALILPALLVAAELTVLRNQGVGLRNIRRTRFLLLFFALVGVAYVLMRSLVIPAGVIGFAPYTPFVTLSANAYDRVVTMLAIVPHGLRLLFWPSRLSTEYGPPAYPVAAGWTPLAALGLLVLVSLAIVSVRTARRRPVIAFCVAWTAVLLLPVSNVLFPTGLLLAERTLFAASVGACIAGGLAITLAWSFVSRAPGIARSLALAGAGAILMLGLTRSIVRLSDWRSNLSLFKSGVASEPLVYRNHYMLGAWYLETNRWPQAQVAMTRSLELFDRDPAVHHSLGIGYFAAGQYDQAFSLFENVDRLMPGALDAKTNMALALAARGSYPQAKAAAVNALRSGSRDPRAMLSVIEAANLAERSSGSRGAR